MRLYCKPELYIEPFDAEDCITVSVTTAPSIIGDEHDSPDWAAAPVPEDAQAVQTTIFPQSTVADPSGAFMQQVTGGNPIQEGLNNLYENFLNRF